MPSLDTTTNWRFRAIARMWGYPCLIFALETGCVIVPLEGQELPALYLGFLDQHADGEVFFSIWGKWGRHDLALFIYPVE